MLVTQSAKWFRPYDLVAKFMWNQPVVRPPVYCYSSPSTYRLLNFRPPYFHFYPLFGNAFSSNPWDSRLGDGLHPLMPYCTYSPFLPSLPDPRMEACNSNPMLSVLSRTAHTSGKRMRVITQTEGEVQTAEEQPVRDVDRLDPKIQRVEMRDLQGIWQHSVDRIASNVTFPGELPPDDSGQRDLVYEAATCRNLVAQHRQWQNTGPRRQEHGLEFTLLSYNILAQKLLETNLGLYIHCNYHVLDWEYRCQNLLQEIKDLGSDIICLQEMQEDHYTETFKPELQRLGYASLFKKRTGNKPDGCAVFYRKTLFTLDRVVAVEFCKPQFSILNRDNVGMVVLLKPNGMPSDSDLKLCVATTHLLFNPRRGDIKLAQLRCLLAEIDKLAFKYDDDGRPSHHPVVLCGDMNSEPYSPLYRFLTKGFLQYGDLLSGDVSGQPEGVRRGKPILEEELVSAELGITEDSRYLEEELQRRKDADDSALDGNVAADARASFSFLTNSTDVVAAAEDQRICFDSPDSSRVEELASPNFHVVEVHPAADGASSPENGTATIRHRLNLSSAYRHRTRTGEREVTTHQSKSSSTVDYIFYSTEEKSGSPRKRATLGHRPTPSSLRLLGRYELPSTDNVKAMNGLPNALLSSDHLPLVAKFLLKP